MHSIHDPASRVHSSLSTLVRSRVEWHLARAEANNLLDQTFILLIEVGDTEGDVVRELGWSPAIYPLSEASFGTKGSTSNWSYFSDSGVCYEVDNISDDLKGRSRDLEPCSRRD